MTNWFPLKWQLGLNLWNEKYLYLFIYFLLLLSHFSKIIYSIKAVNQLKVHTRIYFSKEQSLGTNNHRRRYTRYTSPTSFTVFKLSYQLKLWHETHRLNGCNAYLVYYNVESIFFSEKIYKVRCLRKQFVNFTVYK